MNPLTFGLFASMLLASGAAMSATFKVDTTQPGNDALLRGCLDSVTDDCSFQGALERANESAGADTLAFDIPAASDSGCVAATGVCRVMLPILGGCDRFSQPFAVTGPLVIDGLTQSGASANTLPADGNGVNMQIKIEIGRTGYCRSGLRFQQSATVRGVAIMHVRQFDSFEQPFLNFAGFDGVQMFRVESSIIGGRADGTVMDRPFTAI